MKRALLFIILSLAAVALAQEQQRRIGEIDFYGYVGLDLVEMRAALPLREGDDFRDSEFVETLDRIRAAITTVIGTDAGEVEQILKALK